MSIIAPTFFDKNAWGLIIQQEQLLKIAVVGILSEKKNFNSL